MPTWLKRGPSAWLALMALSLLLEQAWRGVGLPASALMAPMLAGIALALAGAAPRVNSTLFLLSQGLVGAMMGGGLPLTAFERLGSSWPIFLGGTIWAMLAALFIGALLTSKQILPGSTALWGVSPGASAAMMVMSEEYGGDIRLVAFMQYLRIILVSLGAALAAALAGGESGGARLVVWFPALRPLSLAATLLMVAAAVYIGKRFRIPGGAFLTPFVFALFFGVGGWLSLEFPPWLMLAAYALIGWYTGLRFTREALKNAARALPKITLALLALMGLCALFSGLMVWAGDMDPLTAYLAASPGGVETVAIIAATTDVDLAFVMAMQSFRMVLVLFAGPPLTRLIMERLARRGENEIL